MPAPPRPDPPDNSLRVTIFGLYPPVRWSNVLWFDIDNVGAVALADIDAATDKVRQEWQEHFLPLLNTNVELLGAQGVFWDASGERVVDSDATGVGEHDTGVALPANCAAGISWKVASHYRGGHPRNYLPGVSSDMLADVTRFTGTFQNALQSAAAGFRTQVNQWAGQGSIVGIEFGCMSFVRNGAWRTPPVFLPINGESIDTRLDTQRRRLGPDIAA